MTIDVEVRWLLPTTGQVQIFAGGECARAFMTVILWRFLIGRAGSIIA